MSAQLVRDRIVQESGVAALVQANVLADSALELLTLPGALALPPAASEARLAQ